MALEPVRPKREGSLFGEVRRIARTSGAVGGIAARVAGQRVFGLKTDKAAHAEDLKQILGGLKGPLMKVAQFLSTIPDALPDEYAAELAELQANAPPMGWNFVRRRMASELGPDWQGKFASFTQEAVAAASLGQVHRATLADGRVLACKLQYPDMPSIVEGDLKQLRLAMGIYARMDSAIHSDEIYKELAERLREEVDYRREAAQMRLYGLMLAKDSFVSIPKPVEALSTSRLLSMEWLEGTGMQAYLDTKPSQESRNRTAEALFHAWYLPLYRYGVIHGDPHLGNYQVRADQGLNLLDYGAIRVFPPKLRHRAVIDAVRGHCATMTTMPRRSRPITTGVFADMHARDDAGAEPVGALPVRAAAAGPGAQDPGEPTTRNSAALSLKRCMPG